MFWSWILLTWTWLAINGSCLKGWGSISMLSWWCGCDPVALRILLLRLQSTLGRHRSCSSLGRLQCSILTAPRGWWVGHNGVKWGPKVSTAWCWPWILLPLGSSAVILSIVISRHGVMLMVWMWQVLGSYRGSRVGTDRDLGWRSRVKSRSRDWACPSLRVAVGVVVGACWWSFSRRGILRQHGGVTMLRNTRIVIRGRIHGWVSLTWSCGMKNNKSQTGNEKWSTITNRWSTLEEILKGSGCRNGHCVTSWNSLWKRDSQKYNR